jgi:hypothetical protein
VVCTSPTIGSRVIHANVLNLALCSEYENVESKRAHTSNQAGQGFSTGTLFEFVWIRDEGIDQRSDQVKYMRTEKVGYNTTLTQ